MTCGATLLAAGLLFGAIVPVVSVAAPASAQQGCIQDPITAECTVRVPGSRPGPTDPGVDGPSGGRGPSEPPPPDPGSGDVNAECTQWQVETGPEAQAYLDRVNARPGEVAHLCVAGDSTGRRAAFVPGEAPTPFSAEQVARTFWAEVKTRMTAPTIAADPPVGTPSIVTLPVFVQVTNWQGEQNESTCVEGVCVNLTAIPTLLFYPGLPEASPVVCDPPGTRYDPDGAEPEVQASAPGACAYVYEQRSGVDGRPDEWPAEVRITWDVSWSGAGQSGTFEPLTLATAVPRQVSEVQTVVVDGSTE